MVGVDRVGQADALRAARRRRRRRRDLAELLDAMRVISRHPAFPVEPWAVRETELDLDRLAQTESVFALANGHIGLRGNLDEGEPYGLPGTYLNGFYELRPLPYAEAGYGYPESGQTVVNVTNGKIIRLLVDDEPFDVRYGELRQPRAGAGPARRAAAAARRVGVADRPRGAGHARPAWCRSPSAPWRRSATRSSRSTTTARVVVQSELVANEPLPGRPAATRARPPRWRSRSQSEYRGHAGDPRAARPPHRRAAGCGWPPAMDHVIEGPGRAPSASPRASTTSARVMVAADWPRARSCASSSSSPTAGRRSARGRRCATRSARRWRTPGTPAGRACWPSSASTSTTFWDRADVEIEGDAELQQAVRFALFHILQAGARAEQRAIPAKGLTGPGYDGHTFWDTETFVLPVLTYTAPAGGRATRCAGATRRSTLARERAQHAGPARRGVPVADDPRRGVLGLLAGRHRGLPHQRRHRRRRRPLPDVTGDEEFERDDRPGAAGRDRPAVALARPPRRRRQLPHRRRHRPRRVQRDRRQQRLHEPDGAAEPARGGRRPPSATRTRRRALGVDDEEAASWRDAADAMLIPYDDELGVHPQAEGFTAARGLGLRRTPRPSSTRCCCTSPTSTCTASRWSSRPTWCWRCTCAATPSPPSRRRATSPTTRRSPCATRRCRPAPRRSIAAEVGHLELAYDYFGEAALIDLDDLEHNTRDGLHIASLAGAWIGAVAGFGGMRDHDGVLSFAPRLPEQLDRLAFRLCFRGRRLLVDDRARAGDLLAARRASRWRSSTTARSSPSSLTSRSAGIWPRCLISPPRVRCPAASRAVTAAGSRLDPGLAPSQPLGQPAVAPVGVRRAGGARDDVARVPTITVASLARVIAV